MAEVYPHLLLWTRLTPIRALSQLLERIGRRPPIVLGWGLCMDGHPEITEMLPRGSRIVHPENLLEPEEWRHLDRDLTRWCETWHLSPGQSPVGRDWNDPTAVVGALSTSTLLRTLAGAALTLIATIDRARERFGYRTIVLATGTSFHVDGSLIDDVVADFAAAREVRISAVRGFGARWSHLPSLREVFRRTLDEARLRLEACGPSPHPDRKSLLLASANLSRPLVGALLENETVRTYALVQAPGKKPLVPGRLAEAIRVLLAVARSAPFAPALRGVRLRRTWPLRWVRILLGEVFPAVVRSLAEAEAEEQDPPDAVLTNDLFEPLQRLRYLRLQKRPFYLHHHQIIYPSTAFIPPPCRHLTGWRLFLETAAARGISEPVYAYPTPPILELRSAGPPPEDFRSEVERKRAGRAHLILVAPIGSSPMVAYIFPHDQERMLLDLLPWFLAREDYLFVFKLHPFPEKSHNMGLGSWRETLGIIERVPPERRVVYRRDFNLSVNRYLYETASIAVDSYSSLTWEALLHGLPTAVYDPFHQPFRYHPAYFRIGGEAAIYGSDVADLTARIDDLLASPERLAAARALARRAGERAHIGAIPDWRSARWDAEGNGLPRLREGPDGEGEALVAQEDLRL